MEKVVVAGHETLVSVMTLRPATTYHFRIVAQNDIGISEPSDVVTIISAEEGNKIEYYFASKRFMGLFIISTTYSQLRVVLPPKCALNRLIRKR